MSVGHPTVMAAEQKVSRRVERELNQTKVIIRHLPPDFDRESFVEAFSEGLPDPSSSYLYFSPSDPELGSLACSRAYVNFADEASVVAFRDRYDGMVLESKSSGHKYRVLIEFSPFQGVPKPRKRSDARCGTIEEDGDYVAFLANRSEETSSLPAVDLESYLQECKASQLQDVQVTPLIAYLRNKKSVSKTSKKKQVFVVEKKKKKSKREREGAGIGSGSKKEKKAEDREGGGRRRRRKRVGCLI